MILVLGYGYLGWRLLERPWEWIILLIPVVLVALFPLKRDHPLLLNAGFLSMGLLSYLLVFSLLRDVVQITGLTLVSRNAVLLLAIFAVMIGVIKANFGIRLVHIQVPVKNLPPELNGFTIAQISDLHIGPGIGRRFVSRIVNRVNAAKPDIIAFTGDIGDGPASLYLEDSAPLGELQSRYGRFYVPGNHEYYWNAQEWINRFQNLGMKPLINEGTQIEVKGHGLLVAGVPDPVSGLTLNPRGVMEKFPKSQVKILLSHRPEVVQKGNDLGYDLILAGHTHGGQFFPWTLIARLAHEFYLGLYQVAQGYIYVSAGTGSWGPLIRLGTTSEITLLKLIPAP